MLDTEEVSRDVAKLLARMWSKDPGSRPRLIFPLTRDGKTRVSEQESKVLFTQWLERNGFTYSIEAPTSETYQQSGKTKLSGRTDVAVYDSQDPPNRVLNIELKSGKPKSESFRKDFEKLLREGTQGLWFHTLTKAAADDWTELEEKIRESLGVWATDPLKDLTIAIRDARHSIHFVFCVLDTGSIKREFTIHFPDDWDGQLSRGFGSPRSIGVITSANLPG
jgi:hypothetical protein